MGIPKIIHYCWFGGNPLPELAQKCIASWKKFLPDYEIKEWNESNFDINCCDYVREAYEAKKWAFVSDYARFWILYNYGGLYFDTDVELIKPIDDIIEKGSFMGKESTTYIAPGLGMLAEKGLNLHKKVLHNLETDHFLNKDGIINRKTIVQRVTDIFENNGFDPSKTDIQTINGIQIYPKEFFCPIDYTTGEKLLTDNTRAIHHYGASWLTEKEKKWDEFTKRIVNNYGVAITKSFLYKLLSNLYCYSIKENLKKVKRKICIKYYKND